MTQKDICILGQGGWAPKDSSGGLQIQDAPKSGEAKNQLASTPLSPVEVGQIYSGVKKKYSGVATGAAGFFRYTVGKEGARALGYDTTVLDEVSDELMNSFCGVGNPFTLAPIAEGSYVLDIGCGAGYDLFIASRLVGPDGKVFGVDLTAEMVDRARINLNALQVENVYILQVEGELLPFDANYFDAVISNGVINLSPDKACLFAEIFRVLKPGGRLQFADIVLEKELPPPLRSSIESWTQWIGGAIPGRDQLTLMERAGFTGVEQFGKTSVRTSEYTIGAHFLGIKPQ